MKKIIGDDRSFGPFSTDQAVSVGDSYGTHCHQIVTFRPKSWWAELMVFGVPLVHADSKFLIACRGLSWKGKVFPYDTWVSKTEAPLEETW